MPNAENRQMTGHDQDRPRQMLLGCLVSLLVVVVILAALAAAGWILYRGLAEVRNRPDHLPVNPNLSQFQLAYLTYYFSQNEERLKLPAGAGTEPVGFTIQPGEGAATIAANLVTAGLLTDTELFLNYLTFYGLDGGLVAGEHVLNPQMTVPDLAEAVGSGRTQPLALNFLPGWRIEEMAHYLSVVRPARIDAGDFLQGAQVPRHSNLGAFGFVSSLPPGATLEGYLYPGEYLITRETNTADLLAMMLAEFDRRVTPDMRQSFGFQGLSLREAVILASIIEREATMADEKPVMAGVFLNRLRLGMPLQADPTVQYALGYQGGNNSWWKSPLEASDLQVDSPYNTYLVNGLPPGPIANPGLASLSAVANPAGHDYLFFVLDCLAEETGRHVFSETYDEHVVNVQRCR
jgi:UPF0755 protein